MLTITPSLAFAESAGCGGGAGPRVSSSSPILQRLLDEPAASDVPRLFYMRAAMACTRDLRAQQRFDLVIERLALLRAAGKTPPEGSVRSVQREYEEGWRVTHRMRGEVLQSALAAAPAAPTGAASQALRVEFTNQSAMTIGQFRARVQLSPGARAETVMLECEANGRRAPGERWVVECQPNWTLPDKAALRPFAGHALEQWRAGTAAMTLVPGMVSFVAPPPADAEFWLIAPRFPDVPAEMDLRESRVARETAVSELRAASCGDRGTCGPEWLSAAFNHDPFLLTVVVSFLAGLVLAGALAIFGRYATWAAGLVSLGLVFAAGASLPLLGWGVMVLGALMVVGLPALLVGLWGGSLLIRAWRTRSAPAMAAEEPGQGSAG